MVPQIKSVVGGVEICSAAFIKGGNFVVTPGALTKARDDAAKKRGAEESVQDNSEGVGLGAAAEKSQSGDGEQAVADKVGKDAV